MLAVVFSTVRAQATGEDLAEVVKRNVRHIIDGYPHNVGPPPEPASQMQVRSGEEPSFRTRRCWVLVQLDGVIGLADLIRLFCLYRQCRT